MKILHSLLALMFLWFAWLQFNDPDPIIWSVIYLTMTTVCALAATGRLYSHIYIALMIGYALFSLVYLPGVVAWAQSPEPSKLFSDVAKMEFYYIEETREFLGLWICIAVLFWYRRLSK